MTLDVFFMTLWLMQLGRKVTSGHICECVCVCVSVYVSTFVCVHVSVRECMCAWLCLRLLSVWVCVHVSCV